MKPTHAIHPALVQLALALAFGALSACEAPERQPDTPGAGESAPEAAAPPEPGQDRIVIEDVFATPESVVYDADADVYLVSNVNGDPFDRDGNGFISRVLPDGEVERARWIEGSANGVALHAPKGMALKGDTLFVADLDTIRAFDRRSGEPMGAVGVPGATFLNGLAVGPDGTLYASDSGLSSGYAPSGTDAVYAIRDGVPVALATGTALAHPNGLLVHGDSVYVAPLDASTILAVLPDGSVTSVHAVPAGALDGITRMPDGSLLVSSWEGEAVYRIRPNGEVEAAVPSVDTPADIGFDDRRGRVLIPVFAGDAVEAVPVR